MREFLLFIWTSSNRSFALIIAVGAASGMASTGLIALVSSIFKNSATLTGEHLARNVALLAVVTLAVLILELVAKYLIARYSTAKARELHIGLVHTILNDPLPKTEKTGIARLITLYSEDIAQVSAALNSVSSFTISIFVLVGCLGYLAWLAPGILLSLIIASIPVIVVMRYLHSWSLSLTRTGFGFRDRHVDRYKNILLGIKELKLNHITRDRFLATEYLPVLLENEKYVVRSVLMFAVSNAWMQLTYILLVISVLVYMLQTSSSVEILAPFLIVALFMRGYISTILQVIPVWSQAGVVLNRLDLHGYKSILTEHELQVASSVFSTDKDHLTIEIDSLQYRYKREENDHEFSVGPLSLTLTSNQILFVTGKNGAGKTTFVKLLCGLYESDHGSIVCNNNVVGDENRAGYRQLFSVIFTAPFVFEQLPIENPIEKDAINSDQVVYHYLEKLQLHYKVRFEGGRLGSTDLSHGQKKRLALLAAYLEDKPVIIFDEWAENQDPEFKKVFYQELLPELRERGKIVIVVCHEAQYFGVADRIFTLSATAISEEL